MSVFLNKRILIIFFRLVHQHGHHAFCYSSLWGLSAFALLTLLALNSSVAL